MNKFLVVKCRTEGDLERLKRRISASSISALNINPTHVQVRVFEDSLILACSFENSSTAGFEKRYTYTFPNGFVAFDGLPLFENLDVDRNWAKQFNDIWSTDERAMEEVFGTWAGVKIVDGEIRLLSDFTGMTPIYYCETREYIAASTRQTLLANCIMGGDRDIDSIGWLAAQSNIIGTGMPVKGVSIVEPSHTLVIGGGRNSFKKSFIKREIYVERGSIDDRALSSSDVLDDAADSLLRQANSIAKLPIEKFNLDITGGLDSRLVLAIALNSNLAGKIESLQTSGPENGFEIQVGRMIADRMGQRHVARTTAPTVASHTQKSVGDIINLVKANSFRYEGSLCLSDANVGVSSRSSLVITGSAGEIYRRHCKPHMKVHLDSIENFIALYRNYHQQTDPLGIMHDDVREFYCRRLQDEALKFVDCGADFNDVSDIFFLKYRLPHWNGVIGNNLYGAVKIYPLVNYKVARMAFKAGYENRIMDRIHFELMMRIMPDLAALPFLGFKWPKSFQKRASEFSINLADSPFQTTGVQSLAQRNVNIAKVASDGAVQFANYLLSFPNSALWSVLSKEKVKNNLSNGRNLGLVQIKEAFACVGSMAFLERDLVQQRDGRSSEFKRVGAHAEKMFPT